MKLNKHDKQITTNTKEMIPELTERVKKLEDRTNAEVTASLPVSSPENKSESKLVKRNNHEKKNTNIWLCIVFRIQVQVLS